MTQGHCMYVGITTSFQTRKIITWLLSLPSVQKCIKTNNAVLKFNRESAVASLGLHHHQ